MYQSTILGTSVRPLAPPKAEPFQRRPDRCGRQGGGRSRRREGGAAGRPGSVRGQENGRRHPSREEGGGMRFVLRDGDGDYYEEEGGGGTTTQLEQATMFEATILEGEVHTYPRLPHGRWAMVPVRVATVESGRGG